MTIGLHRPPYGLGPRKLFLPLWGALLVPHDSFFVFHCSLYFVFLSCCPDCTLYTLGFTCFYHNEAWDLWCKQQERDTALDQRIALGTHGLWKQAALIYFIFLPSLSNMSRWPVKIADRGSLGKGCGCCCPGLFNPGKFSLYDLSLTLTEKKRQCYEINRNRNYCMLEGNASSSRKKGLLQKTEKNLHFK